MASAFRVSSGEALDCKDLDRKWYSESNLAASARRET